MTPEALARYRPNVGVVLFNREGRAWLGRRAQATGPWPWQFPQGGIDEGEDPEAAARRELEEETGVATVSLLGRTDGWIVYDFPPEVLARPNTRGFAGQRQIWFAYRFQGTDDEVDLEKVPPAEFDAWRWADLEEATDLVVPFKRKAYAQVVEAFRRFAAPQLPPAAER